ASELEQMLSGRTVDDRTVTVKRIKPADSLTGVNILFVSKNEAAYLAQLVQSVHTRPILIVTESPGALRQGSVINFTVDEKRVRFEVSLEAAGKSGLKLSSRLLAVAQQVVTGAP
ncbi:MAG TPA: YfiR family protein, partial [Burkholderiales bacterium]|nr:YfiR family protein [Burkholderiales bacterium]